MSEEKGEYEIKRVQRHLVDPVRTFADEYQVRDTVLNRSESSTVRRAASRLGITLGAAPTGRTVHVLLMECMNRALLFHSQATDKTLKRQWWRAYLQAKNALGKMQNS